MVLTSLNHKCLFNNNLKCKTLITIRYFYLSKTYSASDKTKLNDSPLKKLLDDASSFQDIKPQNPVQQWATLPYPEGTKIRKQGDFL
ncbi:hypothetical protein NQ314_015905 [Rhamnusium bicolor]|uniref:Uncharacterized protein n=1 Tax=Rhamnusium bicolor TaxID=1586634 RepID=A0AAV8WWW7_9CUCU|nr:hypothetical protein NQ314_015905 [Rhamnusium bicolor]